MLFLIHVGKDSIPDDANPFVIWEELRDAMCTASNAIKSRARLTAPITTARKLAITANFVRALHLSHEDEEEEGKQLQKMYQHLVGVNAPFC